MNEKLSQELDELMLVHQDEGLSDEQRARLNEILNQYPEARKQFAQQQLIDAALYLENSAGLDIGTLPDASPAVRAKRNTLEIGWIGMVATVVLTLGLGLGLGSLLNGQKVDQTSEPAPEPTDNSVALLDRALNVEWLGDIHPVAGAPLSPGKLAIKSGLIQLEFYSGARLIVEGPAEIELLDANAAICHRGKLRGYVPEHARGFTVHSPKFELVDLGTEFGIEVKPDGDSEVQVFDGEVELYHPDGKRAADGQVRLEGGDGLSWGESGDAIAISPTPANYTSFDEIEDLSRTKSLDRFEKWQQWSAGVAADPRVVVHYDFQGSDSRLLDRGPGRHHGTVVGSEWNEGRFPGKRALEFTRTGDRVRIDIPGEFDQITLTSWLRMDDRTGRTQALLLTDGFMAGKAHWQISRRGELSFGVKLAEDYSPARQVDYDSPSVLGSQTIGSWNFLCLVYDSVTRVLIHYMNGKEISREAVEFDQRLSFGPAEIGNWGSNRYESPGNLVRNFSGRIDELTLWKVALSGSEIKDVYLETRP